MNRLDRIQRVSGVLRYLLLVAAAALAVAIVAALLLPGQALITLGDGQVNELRASGAISLAQMIAIAAPLGVLSVLGVYWLQRLFGEYQRGNFFTNGNMRCYLWLVWLKAAAFIYGIAWPLAANSLLATGTDSDLRVTIELGSVVELLLLLVIVHLLKTAQQVNEENKAFV